MDNNSNNNQVSDKVAAASEHQHSEQTTRSLSDFNPGSAGGIKCLKAVDLFSEHVDQALNMSDDEIALFITALRSGFISIHGDRYLRFEEEKTRKHGVKNGITK